MRFNRREFLAASTSAAALATAPLGAQMSGAQAGGDAGLQALLARQYDEQLRLSPEDATYVGIDSGERAGLRAKLTDTSAAGLAARKVLWTRHLAELRRVPERGLGENAKLERDVAVYRLATRQAVNAFDYHIEGLGAPGPYGVNQLSGAYADVPRLLSDMHPVESRADADAYISRLTDLPSAIAGETDHMRRNAEAGVIAPRFVIEQAIGLVSALRDADSEQTPLVRSLAQRAAAKGLTGYDAQARRLFEGPIRASLNAQLGLFQSLLPRAGTEAGVGRLPNGGAYYASTIRYHATSSMTPAEVHRVGLEQVAELSGEIDAILRGQGLTQGSVKERTLAFAQAPGQSFPNTDEGRAAIIAFCNERLAAIQPRLSRMFGRLPRAAYEVRRVPVEVEAGAPGGQAVPVSADGSRPGIFYINLRDTAEWPRYSLPTLVYHEGNPGHLFEGALNQEAGELPLYRRGWFFSGYAEGWGLYAEQVAAELGMYEDDPTGRIGQLLGYLFRAARLVVDTGLHHHGWSRGRAIDYLFENSSNSRSASQTEVDRYIVMPGQATGYKLGHTALTNLRAEAQGRPGFDVRAFHDFILAGGNLPLEILERRVRARFAA